MKKLRQICAAVVLTIALAASASADGNMGTGIAEPPPSADGNVHTGIADPQASADGQMHTGIANTNATSADAADSLTALAVSLVQSVLSLF